MSWENETSLGLEVKVKFLEEVTFSWELDSEQNFQDSKDIANRKEGHLGRLDVGENMVDGRSVWCGSWELSIVKQDGQCTQIRLGRNAESWSHGGL